MSMRRLPIELRNILIKRLYEYACAYEYEYNVFNSFHIVSQRSSLRVIEFTKNVLLFDRSIVTSTRRESNQKILIFEGLKLQFSLLNHTTLFESYSFF